MNLLMPIQVPLGQELDITPVALVPAENFFPRDLRNICNNNPVSPFYPLVPQRVHLELVLLPELLPAEVAQVRLLPRVGGQVRREHPRLGEPLSALLAPVGPLPRVSPRVDDQRLLLGEPGLADGALPGLDAGVGALVAAKVPTRGEATVAVRAPEGTLARVLATVD